MMWLDLDTLKSCPTQIWSSPPVQHAPQWLLTPCQNLSLLNHLQGVSSRPALQHQNTGFLCFKRSSITNQSTRSHQPSTAFSQPASQSVSQWCSTKLAHLQPPVLLSAYLQWPTLADRARSRQRAEPSFWLPESLPHSPSLYIPLEGHRAE